MRKSRSWRSVSQDGDRLIHFSVDWQEVRGWESSSNEFGSLKISVVLIFLSESVVHKSSWFKQTAFCQFRERKSVSFRNVHKLVHSNGCLEVKKIVKAPTSPNYNCKREVRFLVFFLYSSASTWRSGYFLLPGSNQHTAVKASSAAVGVHGI